MDISCVTGVLLGRTRHDKEQPATATAAATVALAATAHAGVPPSFQTPSGNILCWIADDAATCRIVDYTYAAPPAEACSSPGWANGFWLDGGKPAELRCSTEPPGTYDQPRTVD